MDDENKDYDLMEHEHFEAVCVALIELNHSINKSHWYEIAPRAMSLLDKKKALAEFIANSPSRSLSQNCIVTNSGLVKRMDFEARAHKFGNLALLKRESLNVIAPVNFEKSPTGFYLSGSFPEEVRVYHRKFHYATIFCVLFPNGKAQVLCNELDLHQFAPYFTAEVDRILGC